MARSNTRRARFSSLIIVVTVAAIGLLAAAPASADDFWASNSSSLWETVAMWADSAGDPSGVLPGALDTVYIANQRTVTFAASTGTVTVAAFGGLGNASDTDWKNGKGTLKVTGGKLIVTGDLVVRAANTAGKLYISGGHVLADRVDLNVNGNTAGNGAIYLTGGILETSQIMRTGAAADGDLLVSGAAQLIVDKAGGSGDGTITANTLSFGQDNIAGVTTFTITENVTARGLNVGVNGEAEVTQTGGTVTVTNNNNFTVGKNATGVGTYNMQGGQLDVNDRLAVGNTGTGYFFQTGGNVQVGVSTSKTMAIGDNGAGYGYYEINNATSSLRVRDGNLQIGEGAAGCEGILVVKAGTVNLHGTTNDMNLGAAAGSSGTVYIEGGLIQLDDGNVDVGEIAGGTGLLDISGGELRANIGANNNVNVGVDGDGAMVMSDGVANIGDLVVGVNDGGTGSATLSGTGALNISGSLTVGDLGTGVFNYAGGELDLAGAVLLGVGASGEGTFNLSGTNLSTSLIQVGDASTNANVFAQTGAASSVEAVGLVIGAGGEYQYSNGYLNFSNLTVDDASTGKLNIGVAGSTINASGGIVDYNVASGILATGAGVGSSTFVVDGLVLTPSGGGAYGAEWGLLDISGGQAHQVGTALTLTVDLPNAVGTLTDHVNATGRNVSAPAGGFLNLPGGLTQSGGTFDLGTGVLTVNDSSGISGGGLLRAASILVGTGGDGTFTNTGGEVITSGTTVTLGVNTYDTGTYNTSGTEVHDTITVGVAGTGLFNQTGGDITTGALRLGETAGDGTGNGGVGEYNLSGGTITLNSGQFIIGVNGTTGDPVSRFTQTGGTVYQTANNLVIGAQGNGEYTITGGSYVQTAGSQIVLGRGDPDDGHGVLDINGGTVLARGLVIGNYSLGGGTLKLQSGLLQTTVNASNIGGNQNNATATGTVIHTGGTWTSNQNIVLGHNDDLAYGEYSISGADSLLEIVNDSANKNLYVGNEGTGLFNQNGAKVVVDYRVFVGDGTPATALGTYNLDGDGLLTVGNSIYVGNNGNGVFNHISGTVLSGNHLVVGSTNTAPGTQGTYNMIGGLLQATEDLVIGDGKSTGHFIQTGGEVVIDQLRLGDDNAGDAYYAVGTYHLIDGVLRTTGGDSWVGQTNDSQAWFIQDGGEAIFNGKLDVGEANTIISKGVYEMNGGTLTVGGLLAVGENSAGGTFTQTGGVVRANDSLWISNNSFGAYGISDGTLDVTGELTVGHDGTGPGTLAVSGTGVVDAGAIRVGNLGTGTMTVSDTSVVNAGVIGVGSTGTGTMTVSGTSVVNAAEVRVGDLGTGTLTASAGSLNPGSLIVGYEATGIGTVRIDTAVVTASGNVTVGRSGVGLLEQTGGELTFGGRLNVGSSTGSVGSVVMSAGDMTAGVMEFIGSYSEGVFTQTGGTNTMPVLAIGSVGKYDYLGGTLIITGGLSVFPAGTLNLAGPALAMDFSGGESIVELSGVILGGGDDSLTQGSGLLIVRSLSNIGGDFGTFASSAITHLGGTELVLGSGEGFGGIGVINDHVTTDGGDITANSGGFIDLLNGLTQVGGNVDLGDGRLVVNDYASGISSGGTLSVSELLIGTGGGRAGQFDHVSGVVNVTGASTLVLGDAVGDSGIYLLSTGVLNVTGGAIIGNSGDGLFDHSGGTANIDNLVLAQNAGSTGVYVLSGGVLNVDGGAQGAGAGEFHLDGGEINLTTGTWSTNDLFLGVDTGSSGEMTIVSGDLISARYLYVGHTTTGSITQSGGDVTGVRVWLGNAAGSIGSYTITGGEMRADGSSTRFVVGENGTGVLTITGGTVCTGDPGTRDLYMGNGADSYGEINLSPGGLLEVTSNFRIGDTGVGVFNMTGGTANMFGNAAADMFIGNANGEGTLNISDGAIDVGDDLFMAAGANSIGVINMDGGAITGIDDFFMSDNATNAYSEVNMTDGLIEFGDDWQVARDDDANWTMSGGTVRGGGRLIVGVFANAVGTFTQSGGLVDIPIEYPNVDYPEFDLGWASNSHGTYNLSGTGVLLVGGMGVIGRAGEGVFNQTGGSFAQGTLTGENLVFGSEAATGDGLYNLSGGTLAVSGNITTGPGFGRMNYDGGTLTVGGGTIQLDWLVLGDQASGDTALTVDGAALSAIDTAVLYAGRLGTGSITQSAGTVRAGFLGIGPDGGSSYTYSGGAFELYGGLAGAGTFDFTSTAASFDTDSIMLDMEHLTLDGVGSAGITLGSDSLVIVDTLGQLDAFGSFTGTAKTHIAGGDLNIGAGEGFTGWGTIDDKLVMAAGAGTVQVNSDENAWLNLNGLSQAGGTVIATELIVDHVLSPSSTPSDISGGILNLDTIKVGVVNGGTGIFTQTGGEVTVTGANTLVLGEGAGSKGEYLLSNGSLASPDVIVGDAGTGTFVQSGGIHTVSTQFIVGNQTTGLGSYTLSGGTLDLTATTSINYIGNEGTGVFTQTGGTARMSHDIFGSSPNQLPQMNG